MLNKLSTVLSVRETRAKLASLAVRLGEVERWEDVSTAATIEALVLLRSIVLTSVMPQPNVRNATVTFPDGQLIIESDLQNGLELRLWSNLNLTTPQPNGLSTNSEKSETPTEPS